MPSRHTKQLVPLHSRLDEAEYFESKIDVFLVLFTEVPYSGSRALNFDESTLRWLNGDGLQKLVQSRCDTSSSSPSDAFEGSRSHETGFRWVDTRLWSNEPHRGQLRDVAWHSVLTNGSLS